MSTTEVVQALISPAEKLIEAVSGAIGKAYEPHHIRKMADAKAYELKLISDAVRNNSDIPIVYDSTGVSIDTSNFEEIAKRASSRLAYQEINKQQNIESVVDNAYQELQGADKIPNQTVDPDWMFRFFNAVENISNENLQKIWGKILAGEIRTPSKYSYRTLEKIRDLTKDEAELFQKMAALALHHSHQPFILDDNALLNKYGLNFSNLLKLEECGLMSAQALSLNFSISTSRNAGIWTPHKIGIISGLTDEITKVQISIHVFTEAGSQLLDVVQVEQNNDYIIDCLVAIREEQKGIKVTGHEVTSIDSNENINYNPMDILPPQGNSEE